MSASAGSAAAAAAASEATAPPTPQPGDTTYRAHFAQTLSLVGVVVRAPRMMGTVVKALHGTGKVYARRGITTVLDSRDATKVRLLDADGAESSHQNARVVTLDVPFPNTTPDTAQPLSLESTLPDVVLQALHAAVAASQQQQANTKDAAAVTLTTATATATAAATSPLSQHFALACVTVTLTYQNHTSSEVLQRLLPAGVVVPSGFEQVGHIAHLNLLPCHEPHKHMIGQAILDGNAHTVRTVVNKTETLSSVFRALPFELLAGDADYNGVVRQHGIEFHVPYDTVYWNSKLSQEHTRLVTEAMQAGDELLDVMAGVGPFAVPAALQGVATFANDLNPAAAEAMRVNADVNRVPAALFHVFNMDGRAFVHLMRDQRLRQRLPPPTMIAAPANRAKANASGTATVNNNNNVHHHNASFRQHGLRHFVMNLPATAVQFLDAFVGPSWPPARSDCRQLDSNASAGDDDTFDYSFVVHVYCFSSCGDAAAATRDATVQVATVMQQPVGDAMPAGAGGGSAVPSDVPSALVHRVHLVRDVAPNKLMVCVSFSPLVVALQAQHDALRSRVRCFRSGAVAAEGGGGGAAAAAAAGSSAVGAAVAPKRRQRE